MDGAAQSLLESPVSTFDLPHMTVCRDNVQVNRSNVLSDAFKLLVSVHVLHAETASVIQSEDILELVKDSGLPTTRREGNGPEIYLARDSL